MRVEKRSQKKTFQPLKRHKSVRDDTKGRLSDRPFKRVGNWVPGVHMDRSDCLRPWRAFVSEEYWRGCGFIRTADLLFQAV
jgi:hypothetical protein